MASSSGFTVRMSSTTRKVMIPAMRIPCGVQPSSSSSTFSPASSSLVLVSVSHTVARCPAAATYAAKSPASAGSSLLSERTSFCFGAGMPVTSSTRDCSCSGVSPSEKGMANLWVLRTTQTLLPLMDASSVAFAASSATAVPEPTASPGACVSATALLSSPSRLAAGGPQRKERASNEADEAAMQRPKSSRARRSCRGRRRTMEALPMLAMGMP
mmetsp:Transcript_68897/g.149940  ORF Transcript_68897/g.149940 Transcript_68897/m.149940 type:complete len:214 (+) Transcript_68897:162-803(+)